MNSSLSPRFAPQIRQLKKLLKKEPFALADYYAIGIHMEKLERSITEPSHKVGWRKKLAEKLGVSDSTLSKCLQFRRRYEKKDLRQLEAVPVKWGHLVIAFGIEDKHLRLRLLKQAKKDGWDVWELQREIQRMKGKCRGGGRPRNDPKSFGLLPDVIQLLRLSERWNERYQDACVQTMTNGVVSLDKGISVPALREQLTRCLREVNGLLGNAAGAKKLAEKLLAKLPAEAPAEQ
jgi:hypothetical protein